MRRDIANGSRGILLAVLASTSDTPGVPRSSATFRWKGENVATREVNDAIRGMPFVTDTSTTTGSPSPGTDGRAGMAALKNPLRSCGESMT